MVQLVEALRYKLEGRGFDSGRTGVDSDSNRNKYQGYFLGEVKAAGAWG